MRRKNLFLLVATLFTVLFIGSSKVSAEQFRVGMEAAYAPFNWTQYDDSNGAVPIDGVDGQWANGYDVQVAKNLLIS